MQRIALFLSLGGILLAAGCGAGNASSPVEITQTLPVTISGSLCSAAAASSGGGLVTGFLDVAFADQSSEAAAGLSAGYFVGVSLLNNLASNASPTSDRTNTNDLFVTGAKVTYTDAAGNPIAGSDTSSLGAFVAAGGIGTFPVELIHDANQQLGVSLGLSPTTVNARFQLFGHLLDGSPVSSNVFTFPIHVCNGCALAAGCKATGACEGAVGQFETLTCPGDKKQ